ncbi:MAG: ACT domain-containing protein [Bacteroidota bacterium]
MKSYPGISGRLFQTLGKNGINVVAIAQGSSELNISFVVKNEDVAKAQNAVHNVFFLSKNRQINLFIVGVGLIGGTLIEQVKTQRSSLKEKRNLEINIIGLANSKQMLFDENGINTEDWKSSLGHGQTMDITQFISKMKTMNLSNSIFIDNTGNNEISAHYESILDASISISTPNKTAASSTYQNYLSLKELANKRNVQFMYEANVGAGLPIISTLNDLVSTGDEIMKIEGVLSGSLSYIFNSFNLETNFNDIVIKAKELGFTEPDPREDLSGKDVARKITILAREAGYPIEIGEVSIEAILTESCMQASSVDAFFKALEKQNSTLKDKLKTANEENKKLRFIAKYENGNANIELRAVDKNSPFYNLFGSDNMLVFTTKRYNKTPLVIRGPGAGAQVTAAGVFAEIIRIANYMS